MTEPLVVLTDDEKAQLRHMSAVVGNSRVQFEMLESALIAFFDTLKLKYGIEVPHMFDPATGSIVPIAAKEPDDG